MHGRRRTFPSLRWLSIRTIVRDIGPPQNPKYRLPPFYPIDRLRLNLCGQRRSAILAAASFQTADDSDMHILVAEDLAAEPNTTDTSLSEDRLFGHRHLLGFPRQEFYPAGGTARLATAGVKLVGTRLLSQGCGQPLA